MKKIPNWLILFSVLGLIIASKFIFFSKSDDKQSASKDKKGMPIAVNYYVVKTDTINNMVFATGKMGALNQVEITPEVNGKITAIYFKEGESVNKGDGLIKLNDADLQAQLLKNKSQSHLSVQKLDRLKKLLSINGVSQEEFDMQENEVMTLQADEAYLKSQLAKTTIVAPFSGVLGLEDISEGTYVTTSKSIVSLVQMQPLFVEFSVSEKYSKLISKGMELSFRSENSKSESAGKAKVYAIEPKVDEITKTIRVRALYTGSETFYPGSYVKVSLNLGVNVKALLVPNTCVVATLKGQKVYVNKDRTAIEVPVEIGLRNEKYIEITSGISAGDTVISSGLLSLRKDSKITFIKTAN